MRDRFRYPTAGQVASSEEPDTNEEPATVVEKRWRAQRRPANHASASNASATPTAPVPPTRIVDSTSFADVLRAAEIARTRRFIPIVIVMAVIAAALMPIAGGNPTAQRLLYGGIGACIAAVVYLHSLTRDPARFTEGRVALAYVVCILGVFTGVYYWGIFSPASAIVALGIFFVGIGRSTRIATMLYVVCVVGQGALAIAVVGAGVPDRGLVTADRPDPRELVVQQLMIQVVYLVTYLIARATRNQLDQAVSDHEQAVRAIAQRDALLVEARQDLDQALKIGGPGRYTDQLVGNFRIGVVLGRGAMGDVYEAVHAETGQPAAVKLLGAAALTRTDALPRFYREAEAVAKLESPHIVRLLEVSGIHDRIPYLAMELLRGRDLAHLLRERRRLPLDEVVQLVSEVTHGLDVARAAGIVHRDIKPQNLFLADGIGGPRWKILDFGVSKLGDHEGTLTQGQVIGTPMYMAPEQARGDAVDHRTDLFALVTVIYRATTGQPPYAGRDVPSILYSVVHEVPQRPGELVKLPRDVDRVIAIGLAKRPDDRFATAVQLAEAFAAAASSRLSRELRDRGDAAIAARPWGTRD